MLPKLRGCHPLLLAYVSLILVPATYAYDIVPCPGITDSEASDAQDVINNREDQEPGDCICVPSTQYGITCEAGFFCPATGGQFPCTDGFYCPANVSQPSFCCAGYYCPTSSELIRCPEGKFCPVNVIEPIDCPNTASCPEGSSTITSNGGAALGVVILFFVLFLIVRCQKHAKRFAAERRYDTVREYRDDKEMLTLEEHDRRHSTCLHNGGGADGEDDDNGDQKIDIAAAPGDNEVAREEDETKTPSRTAAEMLAEGDDTEKREETEKKEAESYDTKKEGSLGDDGGGNVFDIMYKDIWLTLSNGRTIMKAACGKFRAGRTTAIMGPSGAGKTTLVTLVMGKAKRSRGAVYINGKEDELYRHRDDIGFVPQEDIMQRNLTVWDVLKFSADYRLPREATNLQRREECYRTLKLLEIDHVVNSVIGDENQRGISGGQRKRVNIGMELVAKPKILFLDEPTSGLDSVTSLTLASLLQGIARKTKISVAAIIHSPSPDTFDKFDDFTLLGVGGTVLYSGERIKALQYFESIGFAKPSNMTPADFYLEISMGRIPQKTKDGGLDYNFDKSKLPGYWVEQGRDYRPPELKDLPNPYCKDGQGEDEKADNDKGGDDAKARKEGGVERRSSDSAGSRFEALMSSVWSSLSDKAANEWHSIENYIGDCSSEFFNFVSCKREGSRNKPYFYFIFYVCGRRTYFQTYREGTWVWSLFLHLGLGLFIGILVTSQFVGPLPPRTCDDGPAASLQACVSPLNDIFAGIGLFVVWIATFAGMIEGIRTFGPEQVVYWRHAARGLPSIPYFLAKVASDVPKMVLNSALFFFGLSFGFYSYGDTDDLYGLLFVLYWAGYTFGYLVSMLFEPRLRSLWCVIFAMMWAFVFSGNNPTLPNIQDEYGKELEWIWSISFTRWGLEALYVNQMLFYDEWLNLSTSFTLRQYNPNNFSQNCGIIFALGLLWLFFTYIFLKGCNRAKQK